MDFLTVQAFDCYEFERMQVPLAAGCDFSLVSPLERGESGAGLPGCRQFLGESR